MESRDNIIARVRSHLPFASDPSYEICEESALAELGIDSLHLITLLLTLQDEYRLDVDEMLRLGMPVTVGDLVTLLERRSIG